MQGKSFRLKETADFNEIMKTISENRKRKKTEKKQTKQSTTEGKKKRMARKERQIANYFWCIEIEVSDGCPRDLTGNVLCDGCECLNSCTYCGRRGTTFCDRCENNNEVKTDNELYIF